ncbi:MAG TPA: hypothetical protein DDZ96_02550 [Porphyromonadaceae bacterium]|nr:hypothetical protein [Porphyromonadaceae bacterium]HBX21921.1 hypothetical protein [Porphyromonadaceae bacterium]HCM22156.1 hypothetical protein [Porphyromonadaceae bacterium]
MINLFFLLVKYWNIACFLFLIHFFYFLIRYCYAVCFICCFFESQKQKFLQSNLKKAEGKLDCISKFEIKSLK